MPFDPNNPEDEALLSQLPGDPGASFRRDRITLPSGIPLNVPSASTENLRRGEAPSVWIDNTVHGTGSGESVEFEGERPGKDHGFILLEQIGRGGFGEVWTAIQNSLLRTVAVKKLRADLVEHAGRDAESIGSMDALFRREAVTTAVLEHPNIVPVHDLGDDENGLPLLAMKLVRGEPWDKSIINDFLSLSVPDFLAKHIPILMGVGQAVAFAHSRGIVHRDLKPAQVMLGEFGEVQLMDWGLAMLYDVSRVAREWSDSGSGRHLLPTQETATNPSGTPAYMAPEQTAKTSMGVGPWTDVYLLGATLYVLLTGSPPHYASNSRLSFFRAMEGKIDHPENRQPGRAIPQELAAIALKALEKDPRNRYPSATEFVTALREYLAGSSRREESLEIAKKAGIRLQMETADYRQFGEIDQQLRQAELLWKDNDKLPGLRSAFLDRYVQTAIGNGDLVLARVQIERIDDPGRRDMFLANIGRIEAEKAIRERQHRIARRTARGLLAASFVLLLVIVAMSYRSSVSQRLAAERASAQHLRAEVLLSFMLTDLRSSLQGINRLDIMRNVARKAVTYYDALPKEEQDKVSLANRSAAMMAAAEVLRLEGDLPASERAMQDALESARASVGGDPKDEDGNGRIISALLGLATVELTASRLPDARLHLNEALTLNESTLGKSPRPETHRNYLSFIATISRQLGILDAMSGSTATAIGHFERTAKAFKELVAQRPDERRYREGLAGASFNLARMYSSTADGMEKALHSFEEANEVRREMMAQDPKEMSIRRDYASGLRAYGDALRDVGQFEPSRKVLEECVTTLRTLHEADPENRFHQHQLALGLLSLADLTRDLGETAKAFDYYNEGRGIAKTLTTLDPTNTDWREVYSALSNNLGNTAERVADYKMALDAYSICLELDRAAVKDSPESVDAKSGLATSLNNVGFAHVAVGHLNEGLSYLRQGLELRRSIARIDPADARKRDAIVRSLQLTAYAKERGGLFGDALEDALEGEALARQRTTEEPAAVELRVAWLGMLLRSGDIQSGLEDRTAARTSYETLRREVSVLLKNKELHPQVAFLDARALLGLARLEKLDGRSGNVLLQEALAELDEDTAEVAERPEILETRAAIMLELGRKGAEELAHRVASMGGRDPIIYRVLREHGITEEASNDGK